MNILTFDIEEWYLEKACFGNHKENYARYDKYLNAIFDILDERGFRATFFCVGGMATDFPNVVKLIAAKGHEVGCHSNTHQWLNKMSQKEAFEDTRTAVDALEQCIGQKVVSYRAPAFSIGENNKWAFEVLAECGIERDSSVFPAARDFGGFPQFKGHVPTLVSYQGISIKEFPIPTMKLLGKELAYSGGGYFRFFPLSFIRRSMNKSDYNMLYFHIGDLLAGPKKVMSRQEYEEYFKENGSFINRYKRFVKANLGKKGAFDKMTRLIEQTPFINMAAADNQIDWEQAGMVTL